MQHSSSIMVEFVDTEVADLQDDTTQDDTTTDFDPEAESIKTLKNHMRQYGEEIGKSVTQLW